MKFELTTKTMVYCAIFAALQVVLEYMTLFTPQMPQGGSVSFSLVVIFLCGYLMSYQYALIVSMICLGVHFALGLATYYGIASLVFDYVIPMIVIALSCTLPMPKINGVVIPYAIILALIVKMVCHIFVGWYAFGSTVEGSIAYNVPYSLATLVACYVLFVLLYPRLKTVIK